MRLKFLILITYSIVAYLVMAATPYKLALENDANSYYTTAIQMVNDNSIIKSFFSASPQFIDHGYPTFLAIILQLFGSDNIVALQISNYLLWLISSWLVYKSLKIVGAKYSKVSSIFMLFSPLYLTFSAKVYSEPFACFGISLMIFAIVSMIKQQSIYSKIMLTLGGIILFSTKSVLLPFIAVLAAYLFFRKSYSYLAFLILVPVILFPSIIGSLGGGRSLYTLNIQSSKVKQSYGEVLSCVPYYLSYPLGKAILPQYEGACHQNDATIDMPLYDHNPYVMADISREQGFTYLDWLFRIVHNPVKYILAMLVSLSNIVFFEGLYPSILLLLPFPLMVVGFIICKVFLSIYLWSKVLIKLKQNLIFGAPLIYFAFVVTNFPIEPRYFYPLIPYIYFLVAL